MTRLRLFLGEAWGQTEFQVNLKLGLTPRRCDPAEVDLKVDAHTVADIATKGGRHHWHIENQGFNRQKNSGFNLEHVFSIDPENLKAYYIYLLQIAHMILQLVEVGSLLRNLAAEFGRTPMQLFGSLKNLARRLLEAFRYMVLNDQAFDPLHAASIQIRLDSS